MVLLPTKEDLTQASGTINYAFFDLVYEGIMDNALSGLGRQILVHLQPEIQQNESVVSNPIKAGAYNPILGTSVRPSNDGQNRGVKISTREIKYTAQIRHGPQPADDANGIGELNADEVQTTTVIESQQDILDCLYATIDSKKYRVFKDPRVIGFATKKYIITIWKETQEVVIE